MGLWWTREQHKGRKVNGGYRGQRDQPVSKAHKGQRERTPYKAHKPWEVKSLSMAILPTYHIGRYRAVE
jgi:hypothetical protein